MEISSLDGVAGCYAKNDYFANFFDLSKSRGSTIINKLKKKGYIIINYIYKEDRKTVERRVITVNENMLTKKSVGKNENTKQVNETIDLEELEIIEPVMQIAKELSVQIQLTIKQCEEETGEPISVETKEVSCAEVIDYLNEKCHKKYRLTTGKTQKLINARVREGFL